MTDKVILLVDDNPNDVFLTQRALKKSNVENDIVVAGDGEEALEYLFREGKYAECENHHLPVVVLLDLKMPRIDGFAVLKKIRENPQTSSLPVVILTASREDVDIVKAYTQGCNSYICKPVDFDRFAEAIRQLGLYWLMVNEPPPELPVRTC